MNEYDAIVWVSPPATKRPRGVLRSIGQFWAILAAALMLMTGTALAFELSVDRDRSTVEAPGGRVEYTITIDQCDAATCTVTDLRDSTGNLLGAGAKCQGQDSLTFTAVDPYECTYTRNVSGNAGTVVQNVVDVTGTEGADTDTDQDSTSVRIVAPAGTTQPSNKPTAADVRKRVAEKIEAAFKRLGLPSHSAIFGGTRPTLNSDQMRRDIRDRLNSRAP